ncbi:hypothetical protein ACFOY2_49570 [Nonomuraea purpurea]|uniref:Glycoside hydrolase n=1 Tax=Nonomuraea purpurea TaxID=1849276 RepID=A0ABV8GQQ9_9ACTN
MNVFDLLKQPPRAYSPAAIWWWSGEPLRRDRLRWQMERLVAGGVHNLVILNLAPSGPTFGADADDPPFLSEAWWELLDGVCADAFELGAYLWFYDQLGFSGADLQARLVVEHPEFAGQWLVPDGTLSLRGFDYLSPEACAVLLDRVHGEFERRVGHWFGRVIAGSFQDELPTLPTWSARFAAEHLARRGAEFSLAAPDWTAYQRTRAELAEEAFFRPLARWHERHGLLNGCDQQDPARAGHPVAGVRLYADYARTHRWFGAPGSDHHGDARLHASLAHLYGRSRTWIEAFHSSGWGGTLEETLDWLLPWLRAGATLYNPHAVYYTTKRGWWEWAPPSTDWRQPYWRHHRVFADAVTRLCAVLSQGRHVCDVAVLLPTATAQAGTSLDGGTAPDGADSAASRAEDVYREIVGDMAWFATVPGALDRLRLDTDVIDEDSVRRAAVVDGRLTVSTEAYRAIILPAVTTLDADVAARLDEFAADGGLLVAVGALPDALDADRVLHIESASDLGSALAELPRRVEAPVPVLVREVGDTTLVFLTAAFPMASRIGVGRPEQRGVDLGWLDAVIDFDPGRYARDMRITVRGVAGTPLLARLFDGGEPRALPHTRDGDTVELVVPFDDGPAALLVFDGTQAEPTAPPAYPTERDLGDEWDIELVPTLDDTWSDFGGGAALECWTLRTPDGEPVDVTFGPGGEQRVGDGPWTPSVWSASRGLRKDPVHRQTLGPKGHVPAEFLAFGHVEAGAEARFRAVLTVETPAWLAVGAGAAKTLWLDGAAVPLDDAGYAAVSLSPVAAGEHLLELLLVPDEALDLRAYVCLVADPADAVRPEWIAGTPLETTVRAAGESVLQVASTGSCRVLVNGAEAGRQGGFDPYAEADIPRVRRYEVSHLLREGDNTVTIESDGWVLVDGLAVSGAHWSPRPRVRRRQHGDPAALYLRPRPHPLPEAGWLDGLPAALPATFAVPGARPRTERFLLDLPPGATHIELPVPPDAPGFAIALPDDGSAARINSLSGDVSEDQGDRGVGPSGGGSAGQGHQGVGLRDRGSAGSGGRVVGLPEGARAGGAVELRLVTAPGAQAGAAFGGPVRFVCGPGRMRLGDWEDRGLAGYSGGVRYRTTVTAGAGPGVLDLGRVRGTAEVTVNGRPCGVRVCSPYTFDVRLDDGDNTVEILVLGTLGPYLDEVSPTHFVFPGQRSTGLFGPVRLRTAQRPSAAADETHPPQ